MLPSGPAAIPFGPLLAVGTGYSVKTPEVVTLATLFPWSSVNQRFPSDPAAIPNGLLLAVGIAYSVMSPTVARAVSLERISPAAKITNPPPTRDGDVDVPCLRCIFSPSPGASAHSEP